jgi:hypothetical protein
LPLFLFRERGLFCCLIKKLYVDVSIKPFQKFRKGSLNWSLLQGTIWPQHRLPTVNIEMKQEKYVKIPIFLYLFFKM